MSVTSVSNGEFQVGSVLGTTFSVFFRNITTFGAVAVLLLLPVLLVTLATQIGVDPVDPGAEGGADNLVVWLLELFFWILLVAALTYGTFQDLRGRRPSIGDCLREGIARIFPVLGVAIGLWLLLVLSGVLAALPAFLFGPLGLVTVVVVIAIIVTIYCVVMPVAVVERVGVFGSFSRSAELSKGYRWKIFGLLLAVYAMLVVFLILTGFLLVPLSTSMISPDPVTGQASYSGLGLFMTIIEYVLTALIYAFNAVVITVTYRDLRFAKEGVDVDQIAAVFD
ncbi:MAG: hypothetical protein QNJ94_13155 [Alphaproteobacteria bacterium]|nr:hypothetical protein [Alphaproteobacteria bacterium]